MRLPQFQHPRRLKKYKEVFLWGGCWNVENAKPENINRFWPELFFDHSVKTWIRHTFWDITREKPWFLYQTVKIAEGWGLVGKNRWTGGNERRNCDNVPTLWDGKKTEHFLFSHNAATASKILFLTCCPSIFSIIPMCRIRLFQGIASKIWLDTVNWTYPAWHREWIVGSICFNHLACWI